VKTLQHRAEIKAPEQSQIEKIKVCTGKEVMPGLDPVEMAMKTAGVQ
jgi:hypothetical protein